MSSYNNIMDSLAEERKKGIAGQMSLFDFAAEEDKQAFDVRVPDMEEYAKETLLAFEKDVLGIYVSGHPLEAYEGIWRKNITNVSTDFALTEDESAPEGMGEEIMKVADGQLVTIGGIIASKQVIYTKKGEAMARLSIEDLAGTVTVIVFPRNYQKYAGIIKEDAKVFVKGRVKAEYEKDGELFGETFIPFDEVPRKLWVKFDNMESFEKRKDELMGMIEGYRGKDDVAVFIAEGRLMKVLPKECRVDASPLLIRNLKEAFGEDCITLK